MTTNGPLSLEEIEFYLRDHIPSERSIRFSGEAFLARAKVLAQELGNPQEKINIVHIAGTSGKGSTAFMIATLLDRAGQKSGLFTSPHLNNVSERFVVGGEMISSEKFTRYFEDVMKAIARMKNKEGSVPTYFEILTILAYHIFVQEKCAYAVMETGMGGCFDATNIVERSDKIAVITPIGLDHMKFLGDTVEAIAQEKAGIIQNGNDVIVAPQDAIVHHVIRQRAQESGANLSIVRKNDLANITLSDEGTTFQLKGDQTLNNYKIGLIGAHQALNAAVAIKTYQILSRRDQLEPCAVSDTLARIQFPGRFEIRKRDDQTVIFDGAHNPQKMLALVEAFTTLYPHEKCTVIFSAKGQKDYNAMLLLLAPITDHLIVTQFGQSEQDYHTMSLDADKIAKEARKIGYKKLDVSLTCEAASKKTLKKDNKKILVTGSLYLVGKMREDMK